MNRQRGVIATVYIWLACGIAILFLLGVLVRGVTGYLSSVRAEANKAGQDECDSVYKGRDNAALTAALTRVKTLEDAARAAEAGNVKALAAIGTQLRKEQDNGKDAQKRIAAAIATGDLRVRSAAFQSGACPAVGAGGEGSAAGSATAGSNAAPACKLSPETERSILAIGRDADDTARQLAAAQAVILEDRRLCGP